MKKEQWKIAEVLYELGMSYEIIEKMTSISQTEVRQEMARQRRKAARNQGQSTQKETRQRNH